MFCFSTLESERGNLGIVAGCPPHVVGGPHHGDRHACGHPSPGAAPHLKDAAILERLLVQLAKLAVSREI